MELKEQEGWIRGGGAGGVLRKEQVSSGEIEDEGRVRGGKEER